ncbi:hypothetical protein PABG_03829 [Paracoccidioides brasiliensis Pb03]|nr:hypothetical protein PABG_03829 [Paracoccidioides brasiliensis Pb03]
MASLLAGLETPLLKVSRPVAACSRCRTAKIKCDGKLPACSACERAGKASTCPGATDEFAKGKERSYVAALEGQCERLVKEIAEAKRRRRQISILEGAPLINRGGNAKQVISQSREKAHLKEASDIDDLVGDFGFLSVNATSRDFHGITSSTSFAGLLLAVAVAKPLQNTAESRDLPPRAESSTVVQYYFDNIYVLTPFFIQTSFWASFDVVYQEGGRFAKSFDHWIVHLVLAIARASTSHPQLARHHVSIALRYAEDVLHPGVIVGIQAILLLAQYSMLDPEHFRPWYLVGSASRVVSDLGIHQEQLSETNIDECLVDLRRRVFHCVHSLDRYLSIAIGRACSFSDDSANVPLPELPPQSGERIPNLNTPLFANRIEPAIHLFKIRNIQSRAYHTMFFSGRDPALDRSLYIWELCAEAQSWFSAIPRTMQTHLMIFYHLELFYTFVILLSPSTHNPLVSTLHRVLLFEYTIKFITQMHQIVNAVKWPLVLSYVDIQRVSTVASKFLDATNQAYDEILFDTFPEPPISMSLGAHHPPYIRPADRTNSVGRALRCLFEIRSILEYAHSRWNVRTLLDEFQTSSGCLEKRLLQSQAQDHRPLLNLVPPAPPIFPNQAYPMHPIPPPNMLQQRQDLPPPPSNLHIQNGHQKY